MADSFQEKTEPATPRRRQDIRNEGRVARSPDLSSALVLLGALIVFSLGAAPLLQYLKAMMASVFSHLHEAAGGLPTMQNVIIQASAPALLIFALIMFAFLAVGVAVQIYQVGWVITAQPLIPDLSKFNPLTSFKQFFTLDALGNLVSGLLKIVATGWVAWAFLEKLWPEFPGLWRLELEGLMPYFGVKVLGLAWRVIPVMLLIGVADYLFRTWRFERGNRMTKEEVKEEHKQDEGDPQIKSKIKQIQRERVMQRMLKAVPKATVVIANPTHYAVALRYDPLERPAPVVLAKGQRKVALRIRALAEEHGVPVIEEPPLARALYEATQVDREIPAEFYRAVARVLAVILRKPAPAAPESSGRAG